MTARDYLAAVQQRADAADAVTGDGSDYVGFDVLDSLGDVPRLVAALTAALDLADGMDDRLDVYAEQEFPGGTLVIDAVPLRELRAVIDAALTPKENDS